MCGRYALIQTVEEVEEFSEAQNIAPFPPRYNIAPTQPILMIWRNPAGMRHSSLVRWGFLPSWARDPADFSLLVNARSETASEKPSFRNAMRHRRTLIPASGFYEWHRPADKKSAKQPYWVKPKHGGVIFFAGLMESWADPNGSEIDTGCILTCQANVSFSKIHHRLPVVVQPENFETWLDCTNNAPGDVEELLQPVNDDFFEAVPVSSKVNSVANMGAEIQEYGLVNDEEPKNSSNKKTGKENKHDENQLDMF